MKNAISHFLFFLLIDPFRATWIGEVLTTSGRILCFEPLELYS